MELVWSGSSEGGIGIPSAEPLLTVHFNLYYGLRRLP